MIAYTGATGCRNGTVGVKGSPTRSRLMAVTLRVAHQAHVEDRCFRVHARLLTIATT